MTQFTDANDAAVSVQERLNEDTNDKISAASRSSPVLTPQSKVNDTSLADVSSTQAEADDDEEDSQYLEGRSHIGAPKKTTSFMGKVKAKAGKVKDIVKAEIGNFHPSHPNWQQIGQPTAPAWHEYTKEAPDGNYNQVSEVVPAGTGMASFTTDSSAIDPSKSTMSARVPEVSPASETRSLQGAPESLGREVSAGTPYVDHEGDKNIKPSATGMTQSQNVGGSEIPNTGAARLPASYFQGPPDEILNATNTFGSPAPEPTSVIQNAQAADVSGDRDFFHPRGSSIVYEQEKPQKYDESKFSAADKVTMPLGEQSLEGVSSKGGRGQIPMSRGEPEFQNTPDRENLHETKNLPGSTLYPSQSDKADVDDIPTVGHLLAHTDVEEHHLHPKGGAFFVPMTTDGRQEGLGLVGSGPRYSYNPTSSAEYKGDLPSAVVDEEDAMRSSSGSVPPVQAGLNMGPEQGAWYAAKEDESGGNVTGEGDKGLSPASTEDPDSAKPVNNNLGNTATAGPGDPDQAKSYSKKISDTVSALSSGMAARLGFGTSPQVVQNLDPVPPAST